MKKTVIAFLTVFSVLSMIIAPVKALENSIALTRQDDQIAVTLNVNENQGDALTMQASFQIEAKNGSVEKDQIQFHFDESITSVVKEYRYDNGLLTIYISGQDNLFANKQLNLGTIEFNVEANTSLNISFVEDSLEYVSSSYSKSVLALQSASIEWENTSTPSDSQDQDSSNDQQDPSQETNDESKDETKTENGEVSSSSQTGDQSHSGIYLVMTLGSLSVLLYLLKRKSHKINE